MGKLEDRYPVEIAVIGVHSPKYTAERDLAGLRAAVERNRIRHPVLSDPEMKVWDSYAVTAWPTLVFISPDGYVIGRHAGEASVEALSAAMDPVIAELDKAHALDRAPLDLGVVLRERPLSELSFPGKILATDIRLFIADSGHHRILVADLQGSVIDVVGSGSEGLADGGFSEATFRAPQGMALAPDGEMLYVADTENHAVRAVSLTSRTVQTVAGTGQQLARLQRRGPARETALSSPWDLTWAGDSLYIAMAGTHQVWKYDPATETVSVWAGSGHEGIRDGMREAAWLAQPMGIAARHGELFVACAETQAIRRADLDRDQVETIAGQGLFNWGAVDGPAATALFQHNQGLDTDAGSIYVADTYNNRIRHLNRETSVVSTLAGSGVPGLLDGPPANARFDQPGGVSLRNGLLYVADTNSHAIRAIDLDSGHVRTLTISGI